MRRHLTPTLISAFAVLALAGCSTPNQGGYGGSGAYSAPAGGQPALGGPSSQTSQGISTSYQGGANPIVRVVAVDPRQVQRVEIVGPSGVAIPANLSMHREDMADPNRQQAQAYPGGYGGGPPGYSPHGYAPSYGGYFANSFSVGFGSASGVHVGVGLMMPMIMAAMAATGPRPHPVYGYGAPQQSGGGSGGPLTRTTANLILDDPQAYARVWQNARIRVRYEGGQTEEVAAPAPG